MNSIVDLQSKQITLIIDDNETTLLSMSGNVNDYLQQMWGLVTDKCRNEFKDILLNTYAADQNVKDAVGKYVTDAAAAVAAQADVING